MMPLLDNGCWAEIRTARQEAARPCLFLDRDGVVILDRHHLADPAGVELVPGAAELIALANRRSWVVGLVTNQSGIGRGLFAWSDFAAVQSRLEAELAAMGARLDFICACPHHGGGRAPYDVADHPWRKPNPGMLLHAAGVLNLALPASVMVGDRASDLGAGDRAGLGRAILLAGAPAELVAAEASGRPFGTAARLSEIGPLLAA